MEKILEWFISAYSAPTIILCLVVSFIGSIIINAKFGPLEPEMIVTTMIACFLVAILIVAGVYKLLSSK